MSKIEICRKLFYDECNLNPALFINAPYTFISLVGYLFKKTLNTTCHIL